MNAAAIRELLEARPQGTALWIRVHGRSMYPFLRSGDSLRVLRCDASELRRGDVAIAVRPEGFLVAHLVESTEPAVLTSFLGTRDPEGTHVLGRAIAVRTKVGVTIPLGALTRAGLTAGSGALQWAARNEASRRSVHALQEVVAAVRERVDGWRSGAPIRRRLTEAELDSAYLFVQDRVSLDFDAFARAVREAHVEGVFVGGSLRALRIDGDREPVFVADRTRVGERYLTLLRGPR